MSHTCLQALSEEHGTLVGRQPNPISGQLGLPQGGRVPRSVQHCGAIRRMENLKPQPFWLLCQESILGRRQGSGLQPSSHGSEKPGEHSRNVFWESKEQVFRSVTPGTERELRDRGDEHTGRHSNAPQPLSDILLKPRSLKMA